jgi:hypothetical protein
MRLVESTTILWRSGQFGLRLQFGGGFQSDFSLRVGERSHVVGVIRKRSSSDEGLG